MSGAKQRLSSELNETSTIRGTADAIIDILLDGQNRKDQVACLR